MFTSETLEELQPKLAAASDPIERIDLLLQLCFAAYQSNPADILPFARKALRLARARKEKGRMGRAIFYQGVYHACLGEYAAAIEQLDAALSLCREVEDHTLTALSLRVLGGVHRNTGDYLTALECLNRALEESRYDASGGETADALRMLSSVHAEMGDYVRALDYAKASRDRFREVENADGLSQALEIIAGIHRHLGDHEKAEQLMRESIECAARGGNTSTLMRCRMNYGTTLGATGRFDEALQQLAAALEAARAMNSSSFEGIILKEIGVMHAGKGELSQARESLLRSWDLLDGLSDVLRWETMRVLADLCNRLGDHSQALEYAQLALSGAIEYRMRFQEQEIHATLSNCYEAMGDLRRALDHYRAHARLKEEVVGAEQQKKIAQMEMWARVERAEREHAVTRMEKQRLEAEMEHKRKELATMALHLVEKNRLLDSLKKEMKQVVRLLDGSAQPAVNGLIRRIDINTGSETDWQAFEEQFEMVHHDFIRRLSRRCPLLTRMELKVCALLKINMSTKQIAGLLKTSTRTVENQRRSIRRKLQLVPDVHLSVHFASL
jgi:tetratricopeptide (TPR) repeat protein/DNA-binding CsgD family transcriptional regulator